MPELPEVETIRIGLSDYLPGLTIKSIKSRWPKSLVADNKDIKNRLIDHKIISIDRRGKALIILLDNHWALVIHLKMTGQLVYRALNQKKSFDKAQEESRKEFGGGHPTDSLIGKLPDKSTRVIIELNKGKLYFNDQRKFGWVKLLPQKDIYELNFFKKLGPEPLDKSFSYENFKQNIFKKPNSMIKPALMDQTVIAGIGNIYADESLHMAKIHPETRVSQISTKKLKALYISIKKSLKLAIKYGGSTDRNYINAKGQKGNYLNYAKVFRKEGQPCPVCSTIIKKIRVGGRGTHFCPKCQRKPRAKK